MNTGSMEYNALDWLDPWMVPGDTTGSYHWAVQYHIFIEYIILYGPVVRQRPSHGTHHSGREVFTRLSILLPQDPIITHSHPSITPVLLQP